jgi:opacity protein-like surface antigen
MGSRPDDRPPLAERQVFGSYGKLVPRMRGRWTAISGREQLSRLDIKGLLGFGFPRLQVKAATFSMTGLRVRPIWSQIMRSLAAVALIFLCASAAAQNRVGGYIGGEIGSLNYEEDLSFIAPGASFDESSTSLKILGGYRFSEYLGIEADWRTIDDLDTSQSVFIPDIGTIVTSVGAEIDAITIRVLGYAPLSWGAFVYGAGYFDYDADLFARVRVQGPGPLPGPGNGPIPDPAVTDSASDSGGTAILGLQWELDSVNIRVNYEWFDFEDADVQQIGIGFAYRF